MIEIQISRKSYLDRRKEKIERVRNSVCNESRTLTKNINQLTNDDAMNRDVAEHPGFFLNEKKQ